jgi:hypothetical protein
MSSAKAREIPKGTTKPPGGGSNKTGNRNTSKGDIKSDKVDLNPKIQVRYISMEVHLFNFSKKFFFTILQFYFSGHCGTNADCSDHRVTPL